MANDILTAKQIDEKVSDLQAKQFTEALRAVVATDAGRRVIRTLLGAADFYGDAMTGNSQTFYRLGMQKVGATLKADLDALDRTLYPKLLLEGIADDEHLARYRAQLEEGQEDDLLDE